MITWIPNGASAVSDDGRFTIRWAQGPCKSIDGKKPIFYNAWDGDTHIAASYLKSDVKRACETARCIEMLSDINHVCEQLAELSARVPE